MVGCSKKHAGRRAGESVAFANSRPARLRDLWRTALLLFLCLAFAGCPQSAEENPDVIVLHTGRIRGNVYPLSLQDIAPLQHYQYIAGYVEAVREEARSKGAEVVVLDLGDSLQGSFASLATDSQNVIRFFNHVGYDAILLGNLDSQVTGETLQAVTAEKFSPFVRPDGESAMPGTRVAGLLPPSQDGGPSSAGTPVFLISNFYGDTSPEEYPDRFPTAFGEATEGAQPHRDLAGLRAKLADRPADALTIFAWMKFEAPEELPEDFLRELRELGVDLIVAHRVYGSSQKDVWSTPDLPGWNPPVSQNILRHNGGFTIARTDLKRDGGGWKILRQELLPMTANQATPEPSVIALEEELAGRIRAADEQLLELDMPWSEKEILSTFLQGLTKIPGTDAAIYSSQSVRSDFPVGPLRASRVFGALPWTTELVRVTLSPAQLQELAERNPGWTIWTTTASADGEASASLGVTTSRFFASILRRQLGISAPPQVVAPSEYAYFVDFLRTSPEPGLPPGWQVLHSVEAVP